MKNIKYLKEIILVNIFLTGLAGHFFDITLPYMKLLTPWSLLLFTGLIIYTVLREKSEYFLIWFLLTTVITFILEVLGVQKGWFFGSYNYGDVLGIKLLGVPLIIAANWAMIILGTVILSKIIIRNIYCASILSAFLCVLLDFFIEPAAIKLGYWNWKDIDIPVSNYLSWFFISLVFSFIFYKLDIKIKTGLPVIYLILQFIFFISFLFISL